MHSSLVRQPIAPATRLPTCQNLLSTYMCNTCPCLNLLYTKSGMVHHVLLEQEEMPITTPLPYVNTTLPYDTMILCNTAALGRSEPVALRWTQSRLLEDNHRIPRTATHTPQYSTILHSTILNCTAVLCKEIRPQCNLPKYTWHPYRLRNSCKFFVYSKITVTPKGPY